MTMTSRTVLLIGLATAVAASVAGCGSVADVGRPAAAKTTAPPADRLLKAVPTASDSAYTFKVHGGTDPISGVIDATAKSFRMDVSESETDPTFTMNMSVLALDQKSWVKIGFKPQIAGLPKLPAKWLLIDRTKVDESDGKLAYDGDMSDPGAAEDIVLNAADVKETTPGHFEGTTDLTKSTDDDGYLDPADRKKLGPEGKKAPFTAEVDAKGKLTAMTVQIPAVGKTKATKYQLTYAGYGTTPKLAAPSASESQAAPSEVYELLKG